MKNRYFNTWHFIFHILMQSILLLFKDMFIFMLYQNYCEDFILFSSIDFRALGFILLNDSCSTFNLFMVWYTDWGSFFKCGYPISLEPFVDQMRLSPTELTWHLCWKSTCTYLWVYVYMLCSVSLILTYP